MGAGVEHLLECELRAPAFLGLRCHDKLLAGGQHGQGGDDDGLWEALIVEWLSVSGPDRDGTSGSALKRKLRMRTHCSASQEAPLLEVLVETGI